MGQAQAWDFGRTNWAIWERFFRPAISVRTPAAERLGPMNAVPNPESNRLRGVNVVSRHQSGGFDPRDEVFPAQSTGNGGRNVVQTLPSRVLGPRDAVQWAESVVSLAPNGKTFWLNEGAPTEGKPKLFTGSGQTGPSVVPSRIMVVRTYWCRRSKRPSKPSRPAQTRTTNKHLV